MKKQYITYAKLRTELETCGGGVYAVNLSQYSELLRLEGQTVILDNGIGIIENVAEKLELEKRLKRNYIVE